MRAGGKTLTILGTPRIPLILRSLAEGKKDRVRLRRDAGLPSQGTLRNDLKTLEEIGAIIRCPHSSPSRNEHELTEKGRELLAVAMHLSRWLSQAPEGPFELGSEPAKLVVKGLVDGWLARMLAPLAEEPLSLTELDVRIHGASYPALERRLETMRLVGQVEARPSDQASGTPYVVNPWLRWGVAPLIAAAQWEDRHDLDGAAPATGHELESIITLVGPVLDLPPQLSAVVHLALRPPPGGTQQRLVSAMEIDRGKLTLGDVNPDRKPDASISGRRAAWFSTLIDSNTRGMRLGGDRDLAQAVLDHVHETLFAEPVPEDSETALSGV